MKGLIVPVYRSNLSGSANGGLSEMFDDLTLIGPGVSGPFEPTQDRPAICIQERRVGDEVYKYAVPADAEGKPVPGWWMFGGNYVKTPDSRFPHKYPVPLHDLSEESGPKPVQIFPPSTDADGLRNYVQMIVNAILSESHDEAIFMAQALLSDLTGCTFQWQGEYIEGETEK